MINKRGISKKKPSECTHAIKKVVKIKKEYKIKCMMCDTFMEQMKIIPKKINDAPPLESFDF